jgi:hypothetical protein
MADAKRTKGSRAPKNTPDTAADDTTALHVRGVPLAVVKGLDAIVETRRAELEAKATDSLTRRFAASLSRNDIIVDILSAAVERSKTSGGSQS